MNKKSIIRTSIILLILAALLVPRFYCKPPGAAQGGGKAGAKMPVKVGVFVVQEQNISNTFNVSGNILANEQIDLKCETSGLISKLSIVEGSPVVKGQLLLKINDTDLQAQLRKVMATKKLKEENEKRNKTLLAKEAISQQDYDLSNSELSGINADMDLLKEQIRKTELRAPFAGIIGLRSVSEGAYVTTATPIASLQDIQKVKLEFAVPEKYAYAVQKGNTVTFTVSGDAKIYEATVYAIEPKIAEQTRTVLMRAICNNSDKSLFPGSFANVTLLLPVSKNTFLIPTQAMVPILKGQKVYLIQGDSAVERVIKTGFRNENKIEVTEGLSIGDSIIIEGIMYIKNGSKVVLNRRK
ncbi:MAG: efflux RND transporter periplasmic adaptor subunit [Bacteroidota bacterium]|nr:efflux RND transporter periplasmic adaptor subunit [Bacteroidota bacterium]